MAEPPPGYVIRHATPGDLPSVIRINRATLPENYHPSFFEDHLKKWGRAFYVAERYGEVVGYIMCRVEWGFGFRARGLVRKGHVISIAVLPEHRRRGVGQALMLRAMKSLKEEYGAEEVYLEVRVSNRPAIALYEKLGFEKARVLHMYYLDGEDAYLMVKKL